MWIEIASTLFCLVGIYVCYHYTRNADWKRFQRSELFVHWKPETILPVDFVQAVRTFAKSNKDKDSLRSYQRPCSWIPFYVWERIVWVCILEGYAAAHWNTLRTPLLPLPLLCLYASLEGGALFIRSKTFGADRTSTLILGSSLETVGKAWEVFQSELQEVNRSFLVQCTHMLWMTARWYTFFAHTNAKGYLLFLLMRSFVFLGLWIRHRSSSPGWLDVHVRTPSFSDCSVSIRLSPIRTFFSPDTLCVLSKSGLPPGALECIPLTDRFRPISEFYLRSHEWSVPLRVLQYENILQFVWSHTHVQFYVLTKTKVQHGFWKTLLCPIFVLHENICLQPSSCDLFWVRSCHSDANCLEQTLQIHTSLPNDVVRWMVQSYLWEES